MLTLKNLSLTASDAQGRTDIVKNVSLDVEDGKFLVITGPNGGGKTTLAKLIMGLAVPTGGQILLDGEDITPLSITDRARRGISYSFQQPPRFKGMKVSDLLTIAAGKTLSHDEACSYLTQVGLCARDYLGRDVDTSLSGGEVKRIETCMRRAATRLSSFPIRSASSAWPTRSSCWQTARSPDAARRTSSIPACCPRPSQAAICWR